jgi:hypothetical protein
MMQPVEQAGLLLRRESAKLGIVFQRAALLGRRQIFVAAEPVSGVARAVLGRTPFMIGITGAIGTSFRLKLVPLAVLLGLGERPGGR